MSIDKLSPISYEYPLDKSKIKDTYATALLSFDSSCNLTNPLEADTIAFSSNSATNADVASQLRTELNKTKEEQGLIGKAWDGIKNLFGMKAGSDNVEKTIEKLQDGEISQEEAQEALTKYQDGQKMCVDVVGDMVSGIVAVGCAAAAPFTGGASLLVAAGAGAAVKVTIKGVDCAVGGRDYKLKDFGYDLITGSINGAMAPLTNALGGVVGTGIAKACGLNAGKVIVKETGEKVIEQSVKQTGKSFLGNLLAKQGTEYVTKEGAKAGLKTTFATIAAYGADMAVDGALGGATDGFARSLADGDFENMGENVTQGFAGGLIAAPIIGGGFRLAGKAGSKVGSKLSGNTAANTVSNNAGNLVNEIAGASTPSGLAITTREVSENVAETLSDSATREISDDVADVVADSTGNAVAREASESIADGITDTSVKEASETIEFDIIKTALADGTTSKIQNYEDFIDKTTVTVQRQAEYMEKISLRQFLEELGVQDNYYDDAADFLTQLDTKAIQHLTLFGKDNSFLKNLLTKQDVFENFDFSKYSQNVEFLNNIANMILSDGTSLIKKVYSVAFLQNPNLDINTLQEIFDRCPEFLEIVNPQTFTRVLNSSNLDNLHILFNLKPEVIEILETRWFNERSKTCLSSLLLSEEFFSNKDYSIVSKNTEILNAASSLKISDNATMLSAIVENLDFLAKDVNVDSYIRMFEQLAVDKNFSLLLDAEYAKYLFRNLELWDGTPEEYIDTFKYFYNILKVDNERIINGRNGRMGTLNAIDYMMKLDRGSIEASNYEMLFGLIQDRVVDKHVVEYLPRAGKIRDEVVDDIDKLCHAYIAGIKPIDAFVPTYKSASDALSEVKVGDVFEIKNNKNILIKLEDGTAQQLEMSKEAYFKLFPPIERFASTQNNIGNCWEITGINTIMNDSSQRVNLLSTIKEDGNDVIVSFPNGKYAEIRFKDGKFPQNIDNQYYSQGALGVKMIEYTDARERQKVLIDELIECAKQCSYTPEQLVNLTEEVEKNFETLQIIKRNSNNFNYNTSVNNALAQYREDGVSNELWEKLGYKNCRSSIFSDINVKEVLQNPESFENSIIAFASGGNNMEEIIEDTLGIVSNHAYTIKPGKISQDGIVETYKLINPWGIQEIEVDINQIIKYGKALYLADK